MAALTGLDEHQAEDAKQRLCSEPFLWLDNEDDLKPLHCGGRDVGLELPVEAVSGT